MFVYACSDDDDEGDLPQNFEGYTYLPLKVGQSAEFRIDSIAYDDFTGTVDTIVYFQREEVRESFVDLAGRTSYRVDIFQRATDTVDWMKVRTDVKHRGTYRYELSIGSVPYVPLVFPPLAESRWDVNALNAQLEVTFRYQNLHQAYVTNQATYDSTITVLQRDQLSLIGKILDREVYASGLGLVFRENINHETDINSGAIVSGFEKNMVRLK